MVLWTVFLTIWFLSTATIADDLVKEKNEETTLKEYLHTAKVEGIISASQLLKLQELANKVGLPLDDVPERKYVESPTVDTRPGIFMKLYNRLTLLTVLYFGGALLVMGAATLFMTLAWEKLSGISLFFIISAMSACAGTAGCLFWKMDEYEMAGGLMCCISVSLVPFAVYTLERGLGWWPKGQDPGIFQEFSVYIRPGWVLMEVATVVIGLAYVCFIRFPFLLAPVSFSLWFLSMDLAPLLPQYSSSLFQTRRWVSLLFGLCTMIAGFGAELVLGNHPDFGFWLYLFGIIPFWFPLMMEFPNHELLHSIQLTVNACLVLVGSLLDRMMFEWFGIIGMFFATAGILYTKSSQSVILWILKAILASALLSQSMPSAAPLVVLAALVSITAFNINAAKFYHHGEVYFLIQLFTNIGYLICFTKVYGFNFVEIWFISFDLRNLFALLCSIGVACFHLHIFLSSNNYFCFYRLMMSVFLSLFMLLLSQELFVFAGLAGIPCVVYHILYKNRNVHHPSIYGLVLLLIVAVFGAAFSSALYSQLIYYACCILCAILLQVIYTKKPHEGLVVVIVLTILSIPLQSKSLLTICLLYFLCYLTWLAYQVFKNSLLFPVALVAIGLAIIFLAVQYQLNEKFINEMFDGITPVGMHTFLSGYTHWEFIKDYKVTPSQLSTPVHDVIDYIFWSSAAVSGFVKLSTPLLVGLVMTTVVLLMMLYIITITLESFDQQNVGKVKVNSFVIKSGGNEYKNHGLIITISGTKSKVMQQPRYLQLDISGDSFWKKVENSFGSFPVSIARSVFLPYKLTPNLVEFTSFEEGNETFNITIYLGTGRNKSQRVSAGRIESVLRSLHGVHLQCVLRSSVEWYIPYQRMCFVDTSIEEIQQKYSGNEHTTSVSSRPRKKRSS